MYARKPPQTAQLTLLKEESPTSFFSSVFSSTVDGVECDLSSNDVAADLNEIRLGRLAITDYESWTR